MKALPVVSKHGHQDEAGAWIHHHALLGENGRNSDRLQSCEKDGDVTSPLRDLAPAQLAFFLNARQRLIDHGQKLKDNRRGDVGHDAQRENCHAAQRAAAEQVHEAQRRPALLVEEVLQLHPIDAGCGNPRAQTVDGQDAQREQNALAQIGNPEDVEKLFQHIG